MRSGQGPEIASRSGSTAATRRRSVGPRGSASHATPWLRSPRGRARRSAAAPLARAWGLRFAGARVARLADQPRAAALIGGRRQPARDGEVLVDASAVLALLRNEPGAALVKDSRPYGIVSNV